ncbi:MAG: D-alanyl-D-alanine carboxypeptidase family protein [Ruminococcus sp.]|nr:D-alanyl-D-alanine carboxypeptidase family protein [Ruminococcus sp.]
MKKIRWTRKLCRHTGLLLAAFLIFILALTSPAKPKISADESSDSSKVQEESSKAEEERPETKYEKIENSVFDNKGLLLLDNKDHHYASDGSDFVSIYQYLFNSNGEQVLNTGSTNISGNQEMMIHLNSMISDFALNTKLRTIMVRNASYSYNGRLYKTMGDVNDADEKAEDKKTADTNSDNISSEGCYEHLTGLAVDLQFYEKEKGTYPQYTGEGAYSWINENCWKYGFVLRYPDDKAEVTGVAGRKDHYRYVGTAFAQILHDNSLALEELYAFLDKYSYEEPLMMTTVEGKKMMIYSVELDKDKSSTTIPLPDTSRSDMSYSLTGIGSGRGYICADLGAASADNSSSQQETQAKTE